jgi:ABC-type Zn2+ transport system substrate-binding protein/surface adhesin
VHQHGQQHEKQHEQQHEHQHEHQHDHEHQGRQEYNSVQKFWRDRELKNPQVPGTLASVSPNVSSRSLGRLGRSARELSQVSEQPSSNYA